MSRERDGRIFGGFTYLSSDADRRGFFDLSVQDRALIIGWSSGCPRARELTDPGNKDYGPDWMLQRYADTNFWFGYLVDLTKAKNSTLAIKLVEYRRRLPEEPVGHYEPESVPETHEEEISPMGGLWGYALSRVMIEGFGRSDRRTGKRTLRTLNILEEIILQSQSPVELLAVLSERVISDRKIKAKPLVILRHIFPTEFLEEHNCYTDFRELLQQLQKKAPKLWGIYQKTPPATREKWGIVSI